MSGVIGWKSLGALVLLLSAALYGQSAAKYDALIQLGKTQLQAGHPDKALATGEQAVKLDAKNWEGYALAGGALMNLKRYDEAITQFSDAIERAPQDKQPGLTELRKQCFAAESGNPSPLSTPPAPATSASAPEATTTQAEIVLWKSIENSVNPADFQSYLKQYPNGAFAVLAQRHLDDLDSPAAIQNLINACQTSAIHTNSSLPTINIRDAKEFKAFANANKINDPQQKIQAFKNFLVKYPNSAVREIVLESLVTLEANARLNDAALNDDESILSTDPSNRRALLVAGIMYNLKSQTEADPTKKLSLQSQASMFLRRCTSGGN